MNKITKILRDYTDGQLSVDDANAQLKKAGSSLYLDPDRNKITDFEKQNTYVGYFPYQANGTGMLDTGTGTMDKVSVTNGRVHGFNSGNMKADLYICGKVYTVKGDKLVEYAG